MFTSMTKGERVKAKVRVRVRVRVRVMGKGGWSLLI